MGADGTPTMRLDILVDTAVAEVVDKHRVNLLSEEIGVIDNGSSVTLVVDPVDGTANAAAGCHSRRSPGSSPSTVSPPRRSPVGSTQEGAGTRWRVGRRRTAPRGAPRWTALR
jgi:hypothetical protein